MVLSPGTWLQRRYVIGSVLGEGAAATTYAADDRVLGSAVALKVLHRASPELIDALSEELSRLRGLWHPRLARALDLGTDVVNDTRCWFMASERIHGQALSDCARDTPWEAFAQPVVDALEALAFLHHVGTRHGDVKPDNILVTREGRGVLIDLGCARSIAQTHDASPSGTPAFMAPEILQGDAVDERADLYALGKSMLALPVRLPEHVRALLQQMCAEKASDRPSSAREVIERLGFARDATTSIGGRSTQLIERDDVIAQASALLNGLQQSLNGPRAWLLHGPNGIGRSRVLDEIKWRLQPHCTVVVARHSHEQALSEVLQRAQGTSDPPRSLAEVLASRDQLASGPVPVAVVLDDAQLLSETERAWLAGLLRTTNENGRLLLIVADLNPQDITLNTQQTALLPLSQAGLRMWVDGRLADATLPGLLRLTGGFPAYVQRILDRVDSGASREADIVAGDSGVLDFTLDASGLTSGDQHVLARLCANDVITAEQAHAFGLADEAIARCVSRGFAIHGASGISLRRAADASALRTQLPHALVTRAHHDAARSDDAATSPSCVKHWFYAGESTRARDAVIRESQQTLQQPRAWLAVVTLLLGEQHNAGFAVAAARIALQAGEPQQALSHVAHVLRARPDLAQQRDARCLAADAHTQLGSVQRAQRQLTRARAITDAASLPPIAEREARLSIQRAAYRDAIATAQAALDHAQEAPLRARLYECLGVAWTYLGEREPALQSLRQAERLHSVDDTRARFRCLSYRAMLELRAGHMTDAAVGYGQAMRLAESQGLSDLYVNAALNVGSAAHALGDWGPTLVSYERAIALAQAIAKHNTLASLRFNLANLYCEIGIFDRSRNELVRCREVTSRFAIKSLDPYLQRLDAELLAVQGHVAHARDTFRTARSLFAQAGARRDTLEIDLELARLLLEDGDTNGCTRALDAIEHASTDVDADDLSARIAMTRARTLIASSRTADALPILEQALATARASEQRLICASLLQCLADAHEALASVEQATSHRAEARHIYARVAATLPAAMRDAFYAHPMRRGIDAPLAPTPPSTAATSATSAFDLSGFLEINRRINSSLTVDQVLSHAMDAAIALTGAERGFLLLADETKDVEVSVARNVDREHLGKAHMKFSRSIADEVMRTAEPLLTIDAGNDTRFAAQQSVHAMKLKSVVCVPIRSPRGVLGALYLDNRFQRARFRQEDVDVLMAFADQVAIAITNARLHAELSQRTRELEEERKRVERLARGQALEIDRLQHALANQQQALELRHDYSSIVSRSTAMREVLSTLDRVTESNLSVLIQGESGTGKEVVARALHFNGPRRKQPFVSINCGALPEPLLESELFGHVKGAFTGADRDRAGLFVTARGGTLFLDEIGEMSSAMQVKLLRVLQEREVRRVGASKTEAIDVRVLGATNRELQAEVAAGRFREDLYYRLAVVEVTLPPLRDRAEDIAELAALLLQRLSDATQRKTPPGLSPDALRSLIAYPWPGNVRELENVLSRALIMSEGETISSVDLALGARRQRAPARDRGSFEHDEATRLFSALTSHRWNVSAVSRQLGIPRNTLYRKLEKYRLTRDPTS